MIILLSFVVCCAFD